MTNSPLYSKPLMLLKCASYLDSHSLDEEYSCAENQNLTGQTVSPSSTETTEMCLSNNKKGNSPHHNPGTTQ